jgi:hypothetical protein
MSYLTQGEIADNPAMNTRVAQCAATQDFGADVNVDSWTHGNRREWAAAPGWDDAWEYAEATHPTIDPPADPPEVYDPGSDELVITDEMILSQVQAMIEAQRPPEPPGQA